MWIMISWLLMKPADLEIHYLIPISWLYQKPADHDPQCLLSTHIYSQISVIRTSIIRNYWVIRRRWTVPTFSLLSIAIKLPIIRFSIIRKIRFFEVIRRSRIKKMLLNYPSRFEVQMSRMVIMISLFGRVRLTHLSDLEKKVETGN